MIAIPRKNKKIIICAMTRKVFRYSLLWPHENEELHPGMKFKITVLGFFVITGLLILSLTTHFWITIKSGYEMDVEEFAMLIAAYGSYYTISAYLKNQHKIALLMQDLSVFDNFGLPPNFEKRNALLNFLVKVLVLYSFSATIFYNSEQLINKEECIRRNKLKGLSYNYCGLLTPCWLPFEIDYFPMFYIFLIYAFISGHLLIKLCMHVSFHAFEMVNHIVLRIEHLKTMILACFEEHDYEVCHQKFLKCILYHIEILEFAARLDDCFFNTMFGHFTLIGGICACLEKQIVSGVNIVPGTLHFFGWIMALFIGCIAGQYLLNASEIIPNALWAANWYQVDLKIKKKVLFMLQRSQKNLYIRAGPFGILSYPLFVTVLKTSYSIFCMLTS